VLPFSACNVCKLEGEKYSSWAGGGDILPCSWMHLLQSAQTVAVVFLPLLPMGIFGGTAKEVVACWGGGGGHTATLSDASATERSEAEAVVLLSASWAAVAASFSLVSFSSLVAASNFSFRSLCRASSLFSFLTSSWAGGVRCCSWQPLIGRRSSVGSSEGEMTGGFVQLNFT